MTAPLGVVASFSFHETKFPMLAFADVLFRSTNLSPSWDVAWAMRPTSTPWTSPTPLPALRRARKAGQSSPSFSIEV